MAWRQFTITDSTRCGLVTTMPRIAASAATRSPDRLVRANRPVRLPPPSKPRPAGGRNRIGKIAWLLPTGPELSCRQHVSKWSRPGVAECQDGPEPVGPLAGGGGGWGKWGGQRGWAVGGCGRRSGGWRGWWRMGGGVGCGAADIGAKWGRIRGRWSGGASGGGAGCRNVRVLGRQVVEVWWCASGDEWRGSGRPLAGQQTYVLSRNGRRTCGRTDGRTDGPEPTGRHVVQIHQVSRFRRGGLGVVDG